MLKKQYEPFQMSFFNKTNDDGHTYNTVLDNYTDGGSPEDIVATLEEIEKRLNAMDNEERTEFIAMHS
jgi:pentatricopeptide repeat protein